MLTHALDTYPAALRVLAQERGKLTKLLSSLSHLGSVATGVINGSERNTVTTLKALEPTLKQLRLSGGDLPKSLRILGTFPFPLGVTRQLVAGDYANLDVYLNLDLTDTLCGLSKALCPGLTAAGVSKAASGATGGASGNSAESRPLVPMIVGSGG